MYNKAFSVSEDSTFKIRLLPPPIDHRWMAPVHTLNAQCVQAQ